VSAFCVCSSLLPPEALKNLRERFPVILLPPDTDLPLPIQCHPDSIFAVIGRDLIVPASYYSAHPAPINAITSMGDFRLILSKGERGPVYPLDVGLNAAVGHDFVILRQDTAVPELVRSAISHGYIQIPVRQGYAGCACLVTDRAVLTFDSGIARVLETRNIPCVLLDSGGISLPGYDCGFFGGACGFHDHIIYINGIPEFLPCFPQLDEFARIHGYSILPLCQSPVTDCGGIRIFRI